MFRLVTQRDREAVDAGVGRQTEPQEIIGPIETSTPDMPPRQFGMQLQSMRMPGQPKQRRTSGNGKPGLHKKLVELAGLLLKGAARAIGPCLITERGGADSQRRPGTRPWAQGRGNTADEIRRTQSEAEPQAGKAVEFPKRAQDQYGQIGAQCDRTNCRIDIGKRLIDDQPSAATCELRRDPRQRSAVSNAPVRIVGIHNDCMNRGLGASIKPVDRDHRMTGIAPAECMFAIGRTHDCDRPRRRQIRQQLNQCLGSGGDRNFRTGRCAVSLARDRQQLIHFGARWQTLPYTFRQLPRNRPRPGVDTGRQIQPTPGCAAILRDCLSEVATMLHAGFMPSSAPKRERSKSAFLATAILACFGLQSAHAAELPRIASINLCTDQLLVTLADPAQVLGLSPYARDPARSWDSAKAAQFPKLSGEAEDVLILKPDIVVAGRFTKRATRELLKEKGLRVVEFDPARSLDDVKKQIRQMGDLVQHPDRAAAEINRLDTAVAHAREVVSRKPYRVLALSRRGWVSGGDSLTSSLLATAGLSNAAADLGYRLGGFASLEAIVSLKPDFLLVSDAGDFAEDEGRAFMLHPALERFYPPSKRLVIPERLTVCGGPQLSEALECLASELERVAH